MRKLIAAALVGMVGLVPASAAQADPIQSIEAKVTPKKLDKRKFRPAQIRVEIITGPNSSDPVQPLQPPSAFNTKVDFPRNLRFNDRAVPRCKVSADQLENTTTQRAIQLCGKRSVVSKGSNVPKGPGSSRGTSAWVTVDIGGSAIGVPVVVTAFNGKERKSLYLHSRADSVNNTSILRGKLRKGPRGYGSRLDVTIPPLLAGAIERFTATVKKGRYVQARCKPRRMKYRAITSFNNHPRVSDTYVERCKPKKAKKGKKGKKGKRGGKSKRR